MEQIKQQYRSARLTEEEIRAALNFDFPPVRRSEVELHLTSVTVHCECGEATLRSATAETNPLVHCVCGRTWKVSFSIERIDGSETPESSNSAESR